MMRLMPAETVVVATVTKKPSAKKSIADATDGAVTIYCQQSQLLMTPQQLTTDEGVARLIRGQDLSMKPSTYVGGKQA